MSTVLALGYETYFVFHTDVVKYLFRTADISFLVDMYIRMHCQYHNESGILVTHPLSTIKHYLSTSFIIDLISYFPANAVLLNRLFGGQNSELLKMIFRIILKPLQLHRFFSLLTYYQTNITNPIPAFIQKIKYTVLVITAILISSVIVVSQVCDITVEKGVSLVLGLFI